jgi:hypothetical protein
MSTQPCLFDYDVPIASIPSAKGDCSAALVGTYKLPKHRIAGVLGVGESLEGRADDLDRACARIERLP